MGATSRYFPYLKKEEGVDVWTVDETKKDELLTSIAICTQYRRVHNVILPDKKTIKKLTDEEFLEQYSEWIEEEKSGVTTLKVPEGFSYHKSTVKHYRTAMTAGDRRSAPTTEDLVANAESFLSAGAWHCFEVEQVVEGDKIKIALKDADRTITEEEEGTITLGQRKAIVDFFATNYPRRASSKLARHIKNAKKKKSVEQAKSKTAKTTNKTK